MYMMVFEMVLLENETFLKSILIVIGSFRNCIVCCPFIFKLFHLNECLIIVCGTL